MLFISQNLFSKGFGKKLVTIIGWKPQRLNGSRALGACRKSLFRLEIKLKLQSKL